MSLFKKVLGLLVLPFLIGYTARAIYNGLSSNAPAVAPAPTRTPAAVKLFSIVRLVGEDGLTYCSGTVINDHTIITAAHCVAGGMMGMNTDPIEIRANDNVPRQVYGRAFYATGQLDQALINGNFKKFQPRPYVTGPDRLTAIRNTPGVQFVSCGYPMHGDLYCTATVYSHPIGFMWAVSGVLLPGMSGGPTMLPDGTVVAVNVAVENEMSVVSPIYNLFPEVK